MTTLYRVSWFDSRDLDVLGYTFFAFPEVAQEFIEDFYLSSEIGKNYAPPFSCLFARPLHDENGPLLERVKIPEHGDLKQTLADLLTGKADEGGVVFISAHAPPKLWYEARMLQHKGLMQMSCAEPEDIYPFEKPSNIVPMPRRPVAKSAESGTRQPVSSTLPAPRRG